MSAPKTRGAAIAANCRDCIHDPAAPGNWKEQVSACPRTDCPFWRYRPVSRAAPAWIQSRDPADLPQGWPSLHHDEAIRRMREDGGGKAERDAVQAPGGTRPPDPVQPPCPSPRLPKTNASAGAA
jgi:hypothetical protein